MAYQNSEGLWGRLSSRRTRFPTGPADLKGRLRAGMPTPQRDELLLILKVNPGPARESLIFLQVPRNQLFACLKRQNRRARKGLAIPTVRKIGTSRLRASQAPPNEFSQNRGRNPR